MGYIEKEKRREWYKKYKEKNGDRIKEKRKLRYEKNKEKSKLSSYKWRKDNKNRWDNYIRPYLKTYRNKYSDWWIEYKSTLKCCRCDESRPECLDFHHLDPSIKEKHVAAIRPRGPNGIARTLKEIKKCIVLCANCHRSEHYGQPKSKAS